MAREFKWAPLLVLAHKFSFTFVLSFLVGQLSLLECAILSLVNSVYYFSRLF